MKVYSIPNISIQKRDTTLPKTKYNSSRVTQGLVQNKRIIN